jgi:phage/plasmid-associated DNA primase
MQKKQATYKQHTHTLPALEPLKTKITKDLWVFSQEATLHHHLEAAQGTMKIKKTQQRWDITENLQDVSCCIDSLSKDKRFIQTHEGVYAYKTKTFSSPKMLFLFINSKEQDKKLLHNLPEAMKALAYDVSFCFEDPEVSLKSKSFHALTTSKSL